MISPSWLHISCQPVASPSTSVPDVEPAHSGHALMRAEIGQRVQRPADVEDAELAVAGPHDGVASGRQIGRAADAVALPDLRHQPASYFAGTSMP